MRLRQHSIKIGFTRLRLRRGVNRSSIISFRLRKRSIKIDFTGLRRRKGLIKIDFSLFRRRRDRFAQRADPPVYEPPRSKLKAKAGSDETAAKIRPVFTGGEADPLASSPRSSGFNPPRPAFGRSPVRVDGGRRCGRGGGSLIEIETGVVTVSQVRLQ